MPLLTFDTFDILTLEIISVLTTFYVIYASKLQIFFINQIELTITSVDKY